MTQTRKMQTIVGGGVLVIGLAGLGVSVSLARLNLDNARRRWPGWRVHATTAMPPTVSVFGGGSRLSGSANT